MEQPFSHDFQFQADSVHSGSISFGRFRDELFSWRDRSSFSHNSYLEEIEKCSRPGSVVEKKAFFEAHFKRKALEQQNEAEARSHEDDDGSLKNLNLDEQIQPVRDGENTLQQESAKVNTEGEEEEDDRSCNTECQNSQRVNVGEAIEDSKPEQSNVGEEEDDDSSVEDKHCSIKHTVIEEVNARANSEEREGSTAEVSKRPNPHRNALLRSANTVRPPRCQVRERESKRTSKPAQQTPVRSPATKHDVLRRSAFNFRSDERAEKRKEYYLKLEKKTHEKQVRMQHIEAQHKEKANAEMKEYRRSLNFKANPMPSFYCRASSVANSIPRVRSSNPAPPLEGRWPMNSKRLLTKVKQSHDK